ncbi:DUF6233 domain-containing protein [Streptomyces xanthochromogenes]|uniref:DUF6233 domain-containing protein n=1 Tax=Streptomyces xanthochromogenes TaxID=67384 RepID=UPI00381E94CD
MYEQPSRLDQLHFLRRYLLQEVARVDAWIKQEEERKAVEARRTPPPVPDWTVEMSLTGTPVTVHVGGCRMGGTAGRTKPVTRDQALRALSEGVEACQFCRLAAALGWLE